MAFPSLAILPASLSVIEVWMVRLFVSTLGEIEDLS